jgi:mutator protein MutT
MTECIFFLKPPPDFSPRVQAAGCYCEFGDKILFLKRQSNTVQAHTWCLPGGKLEKGEDARAAIVREMQEEVGIDVDDAELKVVGQLYVRCLSHCQAQP